MAQTLSASIYGINNNDLGSTQGKTYGLPVGDLVIAPAITPKTFSGVECATIIQVQASGLNVNPTSYYTPTAVATLITAANT